ncbi:MAG: hypothetical protein ACN6OP_04275 [Pseudomonadales bacterium]
MSAFNEALANAIELLMMNQSGIGAALKELAKSVAERGSGTLPIAQSQRCKHSI